MTGWKKRLFIILTVTLILMFSIMSATNADNISEKVQAYTGVKVLYNGLELTADKQPYIINSTTYVPLRMLMENFRKDISYDSSANKVIIKDKINSTEASLNKKIEELNAKIASLQDDNTTLKNENAALTAKNTILANKVAALQEDDELSGIEDDLYEDYEEAGGDYFNDEDIELSISLYGDEVDLEFEIYLDFSDSDKNEDMTELSSAYIKSLLEAIYQDIEDYIDDTDYEDADIIGGLLDDNDYYVEYDGSTFDFNW